MLKVKNLYISKEGEVIVWRQEALDYLKYLSFPCKRVLGQRVSISDTRLSYSGMDAVPDFFFTKNWVEIVNNREN